MTELNSIEFPQSKREVLLVYFIFFLSGASALICEISWSRQIGLLFGHTVHAASIVLASYFAGMSIGYWLGAKWSMRCRPLDGYAAAELVVAAWTFAVPLIISFSESSTLAPWLTSSSLAWQTGIRAVFAFSILMPATIALGITLPMIAQFFSTRGRRAGSETAASSRVSLAYAVNTAGAIAGVLVATFGLLLTVGVRGSSFVAAAISAFCALAAFSIHRLKPEFDLDEATGRERRGVDEHDSIELEAREDNFAFPDTIEGEAKSQLSPHRSLLVSFAMLSGLGTLALQVLYTRMFSLVFHNSTYTFAIVVAAFLASLSIGAAFASKLQQRFNCRLLIAMASVLGAGATVGSVIVFVWLTDLEYFGFGDSFATYIGGAMVLVLMVVGPAIVCLGMLLPLVWNLAGASDNGGQVVGRLTAVNTLAAAFGGLLASFFMLPTIGLWWSIVIIGFLFLVAGAWLLLGEQRIKTASIFTIAFGTISWLAIGPMSLNQDDGKNGDRLVQRWNSAYGWIDVMQQKETGEFRIRQNLHYRFGTTGKNAREYRQAHIPLLFHPDPQDVLFMGLGTGLTAGGAIPHQEVNSIVAVELINEVVEAASLLSDHNFNVVGHPKVEIHIDDARHHLLAHTRKYDVLVSDLFVPWESESGYLYTVQHYRVAASRLKADGMFCQWLPLYQVGEREFELIANSFASVFPHTTIWWGQLESASPVMALIGSESPIKFDSTQISTRIQNLEQAVGTIDPLIASPDRLSDLYVGDWILRPNAKLNTDEFPRVEFLTPISNRDDLMIHGETLERYFDVFTKLPTRSVLFPEQDGVDHRRTRQHLILFGH